jgi:hypothetical protein
MEALYLILLITSTAMTAILFLVFFDTKVRSVLTVQTYNRAFTFLSVVAVAGILLAATIGFTSHHHDNSQAMVIISAYK